MTIPMTDEPSHRQGAFFGRRKGHPLRAHQSELLTTLLPRLAVDLSKPAQDPGALFPTPPDDIRLEIGFGGAEHLIAQALGDPRIGFIGCEPFVNGMAKALAAIDAQKIGNIRLHHADAVDLLDWLPDNSLGRVDLLYPDPGRSGGTGSGVSSIRETSRGLTRVLRPGGEFRFATDWANYAEWTLLRLTRRASSPGPPNAPTTGASPGTASRRRATRRRRSARDACRVTWCSAGCRQRVRRCRLLAMPAQTCSSARTMSRPATIARSLA
jgi:tRNA (guanine-N7-)-methyltransferase